MISPVKTNTGGEFAEQILTDLVSQGYSGTELLDRFKKAQREVRPTVETMMMEAERVVASKSGYASYEDIFGGEGNE